MGSSVFQWELGDIRKGPLPLREPEHMDPELEEQKNSEGGKTLIWLVHLLWWVLSGVPLPPES